MMATDTRRGRALAFMGGLGLPGGRTLGQSFATDPWPAGPQGYVVAGDAERAGLVLEALRGLISFSPSLRRAVRQTQPLFTLGNGSFLKVMSADAATFHGLGTGRRQLYLLDELTNWPNTAGHEALYHAVL